MISSIELANVPLYANHHRAEFFKSTRNLPKPIKIKLSKLLVLLEANPNHPLLHTKKFTGALTGLCSFRISRDWRVIFSFKDPQTIRVLEANQRKDIYR